MAIQILLLDSSFSNYKRNVTLSGLSYVFELKWISRGNYWSISISDTNQTALISGVPLRSNFLIFDKFDIDGLPPGKLLLIDASEKNKEAGRFDFGTNKLLAYDDLS